MNTAAKNADRLGNLINSSLKILEKKYHNLRNARCIGLKGAIDVFDDDNMPDTKTADMIVSKLLERGIIISNSRYRHLGNDELRAGFRCSRRSVGSLL